MKPTKTQQFVQLKLPNFHRKLSIFAIVVITFAIASQAREDELECESFETCHRASFCCVMNDFTEIKALDVTIAKNDDSVNGINFSENEKVYYLPIGVHEKFPNLAAYYAYRCSIRGLSKKNFEKLTHLEDLNLSNNEIVKIEYDTFEDLVALEQLHISKCFF